MSTAIVSMAALELNADFGASSPDAVDDLLALDAESDLSPGASTPASSDLDSTSRISISPSLTSTSSIDDACPSPLRLPSPSTTPLAFAASIVRREAEAVARLADRLAEPSSHSATQFERCLAILRSTYERHGKLVLVGLGKSSIVARKTAATFNSLGLPAVTLDPVAALHGDMGVLSPTGADTVALISNSGATRELQRLLAVFKSRPVRMATYIAVTSSSMAPLAQHSDAWLDADTASPPTDGYGEADPATPAPTCSVAVALAALDALALVLFRENCGWDAPPETRAVAFAANHCGGQLGLKLLGSHAAPL